MEIFKLIIVSFSIISTVILLLLLLRFRLISIEAHKALSELYAAEKGGREYLYYKFRDNFPDYRVKNHDFEGELSSEQLLQVMDLIDFPLHIYVNERRSRQGIETAMHTLKKIVSPENDKLRKG